MINSVSAREEKKIEKEKAHTQCWTLNNTSQIQTHKTAAANVDTTRTAST
eukprot:m.89191 g.89191  ORF g.89191 m.89191 type:complete len:50 (+) comp13646_c0_seq2:47-196(+)